MCERLGEITELLTGAAGLFRVLDVDTKFHGRAAATLINTSLVRQNHGVHGGS